MHFDFTYRLKWCRKNGRLTVGDLRWWFQRDYYTVREWALHGRQPTGARVNEAHGRLRRLVNCINNQEGFPVPLQLSKRRRAEYLRRLGEGRSVDALISAARPSDGRRVRGVRKARGAAKAVGVRDDRRAGGETASS